MQRTIFLAAISLVGCGPRGPAATSAPTIVHVEGGAGGVRAAEREKDLPIFADTLHPVITARAGYGAAPTAILIDLLHPVINPDKVDDPPGDALILRFDPPVPGRAVWESPSRLRFEPAGPLPYGGEVAVTLEQLPTRNGPLAVRAEARIAVPAFAIHHAALAQAKPGASEAVFELSFSGPVDLGSLADKVRVRVGPGAPLEGKLSAGPTSNRVKLTVTSPSLTTARQVEVTLEPGALATSGEAAPGGRSAVLLPAAGEGIAKLLSVRAMEGGDGFVLDVICDDDAVEGEERWTWDEVESRSYEVSPRCELDAASLSAVHVEPPVPLTLSSTRTGFRLHGPFTRGSYAVRIDAGARTRDGGVFEGPWEGALLIPGRSPEVRFTTQGRYLPRDGWRQIPLQHRNLGALDVTIRHIPPSNLMFWMTGPEEQADERTSTVVVDQRLAVRGDVDARANTVLDLANLLPNPLPGLYEVRAAFGDEHDAMRVVVSDLQIVAKQRNSSTGEDGMHVWVVDAHTLAPVPGARAQLLQPSGQTLASCTTGPDGSCALPSSLDRVDKTPPAAIVAALGDDMTWLSLRDLRLEPSEADIAGEPFTSPAALRASLDTDRGVYRPGETVHIAGLLRDAATMLAPATEMPVRLDIEDARGRVVRQLPVGGHAAGWLTADLPIGGEAPTGRWQARVVVGDEVIQRASFQVEDFVPERMKVVAAFTEAGLRLRQPAAVALSAKYLFGGSAAGSRAELTCRVQSTTFTPKKNNSFHYGHAFVDDLGRRQLDLGVTTGMIGPNGDTELRCPAPADGASLAGPGTLTADVAVFEAGSGRATREQVEVPVHPERYYLGLRASAARATVGAPIAIDGVVVDWQGELAPVATTQVDVEVAALETEWGWTLDGDGNEYWSRHRRPVVLSNAKATVTAGRFHVDTRIDAWAEGLRIRVRSGDASSDIVLPVGGGWSWYDEDSGWTTDATPRPLKPTVVDIEAPEAIAPGEPFDVRFESPFRGKALITVETDAVLERRWIDVEPGPVAWRAQIDGQLPNLWVSVLVLQDPHAIDPALYLPDRAWGVRSVRVKPVAWTQQLTLEAPAETRSNAPLEVRLTAPAADGPTWVTLAAVDEGILQVTDFQSPDPLAELQPRRALGVHTYETIGWNVSRGARPEGAGGDTDGLPARPSPIKPVALWSGLVELQNGVATVRVDVPDYNGELRLMAISASRERVGHAEARVLVRDPLVALVTPPRFLLSGDRAEVPVFLTNTSGKTAIVELSAEITPGPGLASAPLSFVGGQSTRLTLADGASQTAVFQLQASAGTGAGVLTLRAKMPGFEQVRRFDLGVDSAAPRVRDVQTVTLAPGDNALSPLLTGWAPGTAHTSVWTTTNRYAQALAKLDDLLDYPHGCLEQTTSATRPLLFAGNLLGDIDPTARDQAGLSSRIRAGLDRILAMQTPSGGFAYWPGSDQPVLWGTAYATHLLLDANALGHAVPPAALEEAYAWMRAEIDRIASGTARKVEGPSAEAYAHYVLARAGQPRKGRAAELLSAWTASNTVDGEPADGPTAEAVFLLRAALFTAGDRRVEAALRAPNTAPVQKQRGSDRTWYSDLRRRALMLTISEELFPQEPGTEPLARLVASSVAALGDGAWTTVELGFALTGLGRRAEGSGSGGAPAALFAGGAAVEGLVLSPSLPDRRWSLPRAPEYTDLRVSVSDPGTGPLYAILDTIGARPGATWSYGGAGLQLERNLYRPDHQPVNLSALRLGDAIVVELVLMNTSGAPIQDVALTHPLAAGLELERIGPEGDALPAWAEPKYTWSADYVEARDRAVSVYGPLQHGRQVRVYWTLRATGAGSYALPPVEAAAMYNPDQWSRAPGAAVQVAAGWEASFL